MGNTTKSTLDELKNDVKVLKKYDMTKIVGGNIRNTKWTDRSSDTTGIGAIVPQ